MRKRPTPWDWDYNKALGKGLLKVPRRRWFLMSEIPLYNRADYNVRPPPPKLLLRSDNPAVPWVVLNPKPQAPNL